jgi:predicted ester cyclase
MLSTQVAEIARTMLAPFNGADPDLLDTVVAPDYVEHALPPGVPPGIASLKGFIGMFRAALPDFSFDVDLEVVDGDFVALYGHASGTLRGPLFGGEPTGRHGRWQEVHLFRIDGGRIVEHWDVIDHLALRMELGIPIPPAS